MKKTLLEIVQQILSDLDSEDVTSITELNESYQVARVVEQTFYDIISSREIPEHHELLQITAASDSTTPTHFTLGDNVKCIEKLWYADSSTTNSDYTKIDYVTPDTFLDRTDRRQDNFQSVTVNGTTLRITNNKHPDFYTSFDDNTVIMDSFDNTQDSTLQESKVRAWGVVYPTFSLTDSYTPDIDATMFPYLISEAKSRCYEVLKGGPSAKMEQVARRNRTKLRNDIRRVGKGNRLPDYGRRT